MLFEQRPEGRERVTMQPFGGRDFVLKEQQVQRPYSRRTPTVLRISKEAGTAGQNEGQHGETPSEGQQGQGTWGLVSHCEGGGFHDE